MFYVKSNLPQKGAEQIVDICTFVATVTLVQQQQLHCVEK